MAWCSRLRITGQFRLPAAKPISTLRHYNTMKAIVIDGKGARVDNHRRVPELRPDSVLVRPVAIALNPTDWKHIAFNRAKDNCIVGCDYAGVVEAVGEAVTKSWHPGDRICGCGHGANLRNEDDGVFAEYAVVMGDLQMRIPEHMSFEKAATIGLGAITVGQGLYQKAMQLNLPTDSAEKNGEYVLIYGGGTATAALAIQYAKLYVFAPFSLLSAAGDLMVEN
jgi:NADPH:quinone reductase-like Zn-dependent oxidoreductase